MEYTLDSKGNIVPPVSSGPASLPSVKKLKEIAGDRAKELRKILEIRKRSELEAVLEKYPATASWYRQCYHPMPLQVAKLSIASEITGDCGVEHIPAGRGSKPPAIDYVNAGDAYAPTLMWCRGRYQVGCWGDIVERGNYE